MIHCQYRMNQCCFNPKKCKKGFLATTCDNCVESGSNVEEHKLKEGFMLE